MALDYTYLTQEVRPLRICFLVGYRKRDFLEAVSINTILWGGIYNPIIELKRSMSAKEVDRAVGVVKDFDPDFLVDLSSNVPESFVKKVSRKITPKREFISELRSGPRLKIGLNALMPLLHNKSSGKAYIYEDGAVHCIPKDSSEELLLSTIYGRIESNRFPKLNDYYKKELEVKEEKTEFSDIVTTSKLGVVELAKYNLDYFFPSGGFSPYIIFVGDKKSKRDLIEYWNLRAAGKKLLFLPHNDYTNLKNLVKEFVNKANKIDKRFTNVDIQISPSLEKTVDLPKKVAKWVESSSQVRVPVRTWSANWGRKIDSVSPDIACCVPFYSVERSSVGIHGKKIAPFMLARPDFFEDAFAARRKYWATNLSFGGLYDYKRTIELPNEEGMQELLEREIMFPGIRRARLSGRGLVVFGEGRDETIHLNTVPVEMVVTKLFEEIGYEIEPSQPGVFADTILETMGSLEACRVFKIKGVRDVLRKLNTKKDKAVVDGKTYKGKIPKPNPLNAGAILDVIKNRTEDEIHGSINWIDNLYKDLVLEAGQDLPLKPDIVLDYLVKKELLVPGLQLECKKCKKTVWYKVGNFSQRFSCKYCNKKQKTRRLDKLEWFYRTQGMVSIVDEGRGSIPVLLSLWRLSHDGRSFDEGKFITSRNIKDLKTGDQNEVDFIFFTVNSSRRMKLVLGEARNYKPYTERDMNKILLIAKRFKEKPIIAITTLKDEFSSEEKELFKKVLKEGFYLMPMTRQDIDPYWLDKRFKKLRNRYSSNLETIGVNLCQVNFGLDEKEVFDLIHFKEEERFKEIVAKNKELQKRIEKKQR